MTPGLSSSLSATGTPSRRTTVTTSVLESYEIFTVIPSSTSRACGREPRRLSTSTAAPGDPSPVYLLRQPHPVELLVQEVAGGDRPAAHPAEVRHDAVPREGVDEVHFLVVEALLERAQEALALLGIGGARLPGIEVVEHGVLVAAVVHR